MHNVDTEGNSFDVFTRTWSWLYIKYRESDEPPLNIDQDGEPQFFIVESDSERAEKLAAIYLFEYAGDYIEKDGSELTEDEISRCRARFELELARARESIWHQSSPDNPYPNLNN